MKRIITIILSDLGCEKLKLEEQLERLLNNKDDVLENVTKIKDTLREIALLDNMIKIWTGYIPKEGNNDK